MIRDPKVLKAYWTWIDWDCYEARVQQLEAEGCDRSDAQAAADVEFQEQFIAERMDL